MSNLENKLSASIQKEKPSDTGATKAAAAKPATTKPASTTQKPTARKAPVKRTPVKTTKPASSPDDVQSPVHDSATHPRRVWPD